MLTPKTNFALAKLLWPREVKVLQHQLTCAKK